MKQKPLISVITPTYNNEEYIAQCIVSVLEQTYSNLELIIVDDASDDRTPCIINEYVKQDGRIKFIRHDKNWGIYRLASTYNQALEIAGGEIIGILEGDDFWPSDKLEKQSSFFDNPRIVLSWGRAALTDETGNILGFRPMRKMNEELVSNRPKGRILMELLYRNIIPPVSVLMRKNTLLSIGGFQHRSYLQYVDYPTFLVMSLQGEFCFVNMVAGYWRRHRSQITVKFSEELAKGASRFVEEFFPLIPDGIRAKYNFTLTKVRRYERFRIARVYFSEAKISLAKQNWKEAHKIFKIIIKKAPFYMKFFALIGTFISYCKIDIRQFIPSEKALRKKSKF